MSATPSFYPPSPGLVPEELTRVTGAFRLRAMFLVGFVIFFFLLYLGLIVLSWYLFWLGIVLQLAFQKYGAISHVFTWWPWFPTQGYWDDPNTGFPQVWAWDWTHISNVLWHLVLPALTLSLGTLAGISLVMRSSLIDVMTEDFVLTAKEVPLVMKALRDNGIEVTALHNHMLDDQPRLFFMHFWANDDAGKLAQGLKAALDKINVKHG